VLEDAVDGGEGVEGAGGVAVHEAERADEADARRHGRLERGDDAVEERDGARRE
jgi:hypothetical protein